jgi:MFS family permease
MHDEQSRVEPVPKLPVATVIGIAAAVGMVPLNATMIAVALPSIAEDFEISTGTASILVTVYLLTMLVGQPLAGRFADWFGTQRTVTLALLGVMVTSVGCALAPTFSLLVIARLAQGATLAALGPSVQSLLRALTSPEEQGRTFGIMGSVLGGGAVLGPVIGGVLTQAFGWQAIFLVNVPIAAGALVAARRAGRGAVERSAERPADTEGDRILNRVFVAAFSVQSFSTLAQYALLLLTPIILHARGWSTGSIGLVLSALTLGSIVMGPIGGRAGDERGRRAISAIGTSIAAVGVAVVMIAGPSVSVILLVLGLGAFGVGFGLTQPNLMSAALESVPMSRTGSAAGVLSMSRYVGSVTTSLVIAAVVTVDGSGSRFVLGLSFVSMLAALLVSSQLPSKGDPASVQTVTPGSTEISSSQSSAQPE